MNNLVVGMTGAMLFILSILIMNLRADVKLLEENQLKILKRERVNLISRLKQMKEEGVNRNAPSQEE